MRASASPSISASVPRASGMSLTLELLAIMHHKSKEHYNVETRVCRLARGEGC